MLEPIGLHIIKKGIDWALHKLKSKPAGQDGLPEPSILDQVHRFKRVIAAHGMRPEHWSRFFSACDAPFAIARTDQINDDALLAWMDDDKVDWLCEIFLINRDWMDGEACTRPHNSIYFNKRPEYFFKTIEGELNKRTNKIREESAQVLFSLDSNDLNAEEDSGARLSVAIAIPLCRLSSELIVYRYIKDGASGGYPWHDEPYRSHVKIMARLSHLHFQFWVYGLYFEKSNFIAVEDGRLLIPEALSKPGHHHCSWHPEDYALADCESRVAKETESLPISLEWMQQLCLPTATTTGRKRRGKT